MADFFSLLILFWIAWIIDRHQYNRNKKFQDQIDERSRQFVEEALHWSEEANKRWRNNPERLRTIEMKKEVLGDLYYDPYEEEQNDEQLH